MVERLSPSDLTRVVFFLGQSPSITIKNDGFLFADAFDVVIPFKFLEQIRERVATDISFKVLEKAFKGIIKIGRKDGKLNKTYYITPGEDRKLYDFMQRGGCVLCMEKGSDVKMACGCNFHFACVSSWLKLTASEIKYQTDNPSQNYDPPETMYVQCVLCKNNPHKPMHFWRITITPDGTIYDEHASTSFVPPPSLPYPGVVEPYPITGLGLHRSSAVARAAGAPAADTDVDTAIYVDSDRDEDSSLRRDGEVIVVDD